MGMQKAWPSKTTRLCFDMLQQKEGNGQLLHADDDVGGLHDGEGLRAHFQAQALDGLVRDGAGDLLACLLYTSRCV